MEASPGEQVAKGAPRVTLCMNKYGILQSRSREVIEIEENSACRSLGLSEESPAAPETLCGLGAERG